MKKLLFLYSFLLLIQLLQAQSACPISSLGQNPSTAFPVCGVKSFSQGSVNLCGNTVVPVPACNGTVTYTNINPYWYKFTSYTSGTLEFVITPNNLTDDYDWQLFDITNSQNPDFDVFNNTSLFVDCNWSGVTGQTGTSDTASANNQCASPTSYAAGGVSPFSKPPNLIKGHTYLLLVSHYTNTQSGYSLSFTGGTSSITDPSIPNYIKASGVCGGDKVSIKLTKRILCTTIAANGSDFAITPSNGFSISSASGYNCNNSFDTDSIIVQLNGLLSPANYIIQQQIGTDQNTLLDNCQNATPVGTSTPFNIISQQLIKADFNYTIHYGCVIDTINFYLGGRNVVNWTWIFDNSIVNTTTANPILYYTTYGKKTAKLIAQNTVCTDSAFISYTLTNSPSKAAFSSANFACPSDTVSFQNNSIGHIASWYWDFSNGHISTNKTPAIQIFPASNSLKEYPVSLVITDSIGCSDTTYKIITVAPNCYIAVPSAFTPNGDGRNDYLYPLNAYKASNLIFRVFNRFGQLIFETQDWTKKWDGKLNGIDQPAGTYVWYLNYTDTDTHKNVSLKGTTVLIR